MLSCYNYKDYSWLTIPALLMSTSRRPYLCSTSSLARPMLSPLSTSRRRNSGESPSEINLSTASCPRWVLRAVRNRAGLKVNVRHLVSPAMRGCLAWHNIKQQWFKYTHTHTHRPARLSHQTSSKVAELLPVQCLGLHQSPVQSIEVYTYMYMLFVYQSHSLHDNTLLHTVSGRDLLC